MDLSDRALIDKFLLTKDFTSYSTLVRRYQNRVYSAAFRILGNAEEAEEVVQDTFVRAHQNLDKFRHQCQFSSWVLRICHNRCLDIMRVKLRRSNLQINTSYVHEREDLDLSLDTIGQLADNQPGPAQQLDSIEQEQIVAESLQKLPYEQRIVLVLHDIEGLSYQEIADVVGEKIGTVRSRLHYGRLKLRQLLVPYFSFSAASAASR